MNGTLQNENKLVGTLSSGSTMRGGLGTVIARDGKDGVSATHSWSGTVLTVTSASGTSSADLKGEKGEKGADGTMTFEELTDEQKATLKGEKGDPGIQGEKGEPGVSGVYVGSGDMPEGYNVQIDPNGEGNPIDEIAAEVAEIVMDSLRESANVRIGEVFLPANAWSGTESPYWQSVSIPTVTPNTQVDLTPSAEQLSVFHHKDLAFVTENEDGAVTVYAIGQKPENDYTIQVTMTEVYV